MLNEVNIIGNLGRDPEPFDTRNGRGCRMSVATTYKPKEGEEVTEWHRVVVFGKQADFCIDWLKTGRQVYVTGRLNTSKYEKEGVTHYSTDIVAVRVIALGPKDANAKSAAATTGAAGAAFAADAGDVPF
jgi:single-strand DNA-binding protein